MTKEPPLPPRRIKQARRAIGITQITISGFKSLSNKVEAEIRPLTILAGANSSGKSSLIQPLLLMKQTLEAPYDPGALLLNGPNVKFTSPEQFFPLSIHESAPELIVEFELEQSDKLSITFSRRSEDRKIIVSEMRYYDAPDDRMAEARTSIFSPDMSSDEIIPQLPIWVALGSRTWRIGREDSLWEWAIERNRCFLNLEVYDKQTRQVFTPITPNDWRQPFEQNLLRLIHVPGLRSNIERVYPTSSFAESRFQGTFDHYVAGVINDWRANSDARINKLADTLASIGLTSHIITNVIDYTSVELRVGRTIQSPPGDTVSIADVGFGVSQVLPVLVALLVAEPGQLVYIEQPELHLHPKAQVALAQVLADAANRGVRIVAETHSDLLLLGVQTLVAEGKLAPDLVKLHWFDRGEDGATTITSADLDEDGAYGDWPENFADVDLEAQKRYLDASAVRNMGT